MSTARAATEEEAANLALSCLNEPGIGIITEDTKPGRAVRKWFGTARDAVLREQDWNFATAWAEPALDPVAGLGNLTKRFPLPDDCVAVRFVDELETDEWAIESGSVTVAGVPVEMEVLVCNVADPLVCYTRRVTAVRLWDAQFLLGFAERLAELMASEFGKSAADVQRIAAIADDRIGKAALRDARERAPRVISRDTSWTRSRTQWPSR